MQTGSAMSSSAVKRASGYHLRVTAGVDAGKTFALVPMRLTVGRSADADIEINEIYSPRRRFAIDWLPERGQRVLDIWPHQIPVFVNDKRCEDSQTIVLLEGDRVRLGGTEFVFELTDAEPDAAADPGVV